MNKTMRLIMAGGCAVATVLMPVGAGAQDFLDQLDHEMRVESAEGLFRADLSGRLDLETYTVDQTPPGLVFPDDDLFFNPRLSLFVDAQLGERLYALVQSRFDRGFDPGLVPEGDVRVDEFLLRYTVLDRGRLNLQVGKFATVFGGWVPRHLAWENPFINAPLAYEHVTTITDQVVPGGPAGFLGRQTLPDNKRGWVPVIWGPAYTAGLSAFGAWKKVDYAFEIKNAAISSRPPAWDPFDVGWEHPTLSGRIGHRPSAMWNVGASVSHGAYLLPGTVLPPGTDRGDFDQTTVGTDVTFSWHHWQVWAEAMAARFDVPNVGAAETLSYYLETKYKFTPRFYGALRWNQQFFDKIPDGTGGQSAWDRDTWRVETALGFRWTRHFQTKLQYGYSRQRGTPQQGEQLVAAQATVKF